MADQNATIKMLVKLDGSEDLSLIAARQLVWQKAGVTCTPVFSPPIDALVLALATLIEETRKATEAFEIFKARFEALEERERWEHRPVSGRITFGRPVKGVVSFPH